MKTTLLIEGQDSYLPEQKQEPCFIELQNVELLQNEMKRVTSAIMFIEFILKAFPSNKQKKRYEKRVAQLKDDLSFLQLHLDLLEQEVAI